MAYDPVVYFNGLAEQAEANGETDTAVRLRLMAVEAAKAAKAAARGARKAKRDNPPLMGFASYGRGFTIKPF